MLVNLLKKYFNTESAEVLAGFFLEKEYVKDSILFKVNEESKKELYFILDGIVDFYLTKNGNEKKIASATVGDFFGELSFIDGLPRSATAVAKTDLKVGIFSRDNFMKLKADNLNIYVELLEVLLKILSAKIRKIDEEQL